MFKQFQIIKRLYIFTNRCYSYILIYKPKLIWVYVNIPILIIFDVTNVRHSLEEEEDSYLRIIFKPPKCKGFVFACVCKWH